MLHEILTTLKLMICGSSGQVRGKLRRPPQFPYGSTVGPMSIVKLTHLVKNITFKVITAMAVKIP